MREGQHPSFLYQIALGLYWLSTPVVELIAHLSGAAGSDISILSNKARSFTFRKERPWKHVLPDMHFSDRRKSRRLLTMLIFAGPTITCDFSN